MQLTGCLVEGVSFVQAKEAELAANNSTFNNFKQSYDLARTTVTRTNYEVDFINAFNKLSDLGAKFDPDAYLHSKEIVRLQ